MKKQKNDLSLSSIVSPAYERFFNKFQEIKTKEISQWSIPHILGYFCDKYKSYYNYDFTFSFNNPTPSKSSEVHQIKKLCTQLSSDPVILKNYIDWIFETKVKLRKRKITSIGFLSNPGIVSEYKEKLLSKKQIDRSTKLPDNVLNEINEFNLGISTYGELAFVKKSFDHDQNEFKNLFEKLNKINFNLSILEKIQ